MSCYDRYGAQFGSEKLGILYNNQLGDAFIASSDERKFSSSRENSPKPGSRTLSGMAPNVIVDESGDVKMVSGAAGGVQIPPSVSWVSQSNYLIYHKKRKAFINEALSY